MLKRMKNLLIAATLSLFVLSLTGCYTQIGKPGVQTDVYDDDEYYSQSREPQDELYWDEYGREYYEDEPRQDVVYHHYDHDVYVHGGYAPVYLNSWWYEPYWYYSSSPWYRVDYYDPWHGFHFSWGDPYYWPHYTHYGGWGYFSHRWAYSRPYYSVPVYPIYAGSGGGGSGYVNDRRDFGRRAITQTRPSRMRTVMTGAGPSVVTRDRSGTADRRSTITNASRTRTSTPAVTGRRSTVTTRTRSDDFSRTRSSITNRAVQRSTPETATRPSTRTRSREATVDRSTSDRSRSSAVGTRSRAVTNRSRSSDSAPSYNRSSSSRSRSSSSGYRPSSSRSRSSSSGYRPSSSSRRSSSASRSSSTYSGSRSRSSSGSSATRSSGSSSSSSSSSGSSSSGRSRR